MRRDSAKRADTTTGYPRAGAGHVCPFDGVCADGSRSSRHWRRHGVHEDRVLGKGLVRHDAPEQEADLPPRALRFFPRAVAHAHQAADIHPPGRCAPLKARCPTARTNQESPARQSRGALGGVEVGGRRPCAQAGRCRPLPGSIATTWREKAHQCPVGQQPAKNAARKSKKSWELVMPSALKSASAEKKSVRKSKKSWESTFPEAFQSAGHSWPRIVLMRVAI
jgi:hypothetical protein